ncbi:MAG: hypothetical protein RL557_802 [archaeon]|jgi:hypothetical protein
MARAVYVEGRRPYPDLNQEGQKERVVGIFIGFGNYLREEGVHDEGLGVSWIIHVEPLSICQRKDIARLVNDCPTIEKNSDDPLIAMVEYSGYPLDRLMHSHQDMLDSFMRGIYMRPVSLESPAKTAQAVLSSS